MRGSLCPDTPGHSPVHTPHKLLQLPHAGPGLEVLHAWLPIRPNVHVELSLISLGVHQSWLAGQDERTQPDGVDLRGQGSGLVSGSRHRTGPTHIPQRETLSLQPSLEAPSCSLLWLPLYPCQILPLYLMGPAAHLAPLSCRPV